MKLEWNFFEIQILGERVSGGLGRYLEKNLGNLGKHTLNLQGFCHFAKKKAPLKDFYRNVISVSVSIFFYARSLKSI